MKLQSIFTEIYLTNKWEDSFSLSGKGSSIEQTKKIRVILPLLIEKYKMTSMLDIPCGDFFWMKEIKTHLSKILHTYIGGDIVNEIITINRGKFEDAFFKFKHYDLSNSKLPNVDIILCRDCLVHFSYYDILKALINIKKSRSTFLLTTTFPSQINRDIETGNWRPINLQKFPFFFSNPLEIYFEDCSHDGDQFIDKSIALWKVEKIGLFRFRILVLLLIIYRKVNSILKILIRGFQY